MDWKQWGRQIHAAPGELKGEPGTWRVFKPNVYEPWELWFLPSGFSPAGTGSRNRRKGRFVSGGHKTAAVAKAAIEAAS